MAATANGVAGLWAKFAAGLAALVASGFLTWAAVVWHQAEQVRELLFKVHSELSTLAAAIDYLQERQRATETAQATHRDIPWHPRAGAHLERLRLEMDTMQRGRRSAD